jgi:hypothetical protein
MPKIVQADLGDAMIVSTPESVLLKLLWDLKKANGRPPGVSAHELARRVQAMQSAGVIVYPSREVEDLECSLFDDLSELEARGMLRWQAEHVADLTTYGGMVASSLEYPSWMRESVIAGLDAGLAKSV